MLFLAHPCSHQAIVVYSQGARLFSSFYSVARKTEGKTTDSNSVF